MKSHFKIIALILALIMALGTITACNNADTDATDSDNTESESSTSTDDSTAANLSLFPENAFPIFDGSVYAAKVVTSDTAGSSERQVASSLRTAFKNQTKVTLNSSTDFLNKGESYDSNAYEILIGQTKHEESQSVFGSVTFNSYGIKLVGNKIIFFFSTIDEGKELVSIFTSALKTTDKGALWVPSSISFTKNLSIELIDVPQYPAKSLSTVDCADDTTMVVASNTTLAKFNEYCATLTSNGYAEYSKRENIDGSYFRTYTKDDKALTVYFSEGTKQARIIAGPLKDIPSKEIDQTPEAYEPSLTFIGPSESVGNGLALIYQLANGKFIIIDGGYYLSDRIYKELKEIQPNAKTYTIAAWFVSHPHIDHHEALENFLSQHANEVVIENIFFNYVNAEYYDVLTAADQQTEDAKESKTVNKLRELIAKNLSRDTKVIKPHTGQIYSFGKSAEVEILWTIEDYLPEKLDRINTSSMIIRVTVAGTSTIVLADATGFSKEIMLKMYNSHLESDIVTLAHHGIWVDTPEMYNTIKASVLLWPSNKTEANTYYVHDFSKRAIMAALNNATDVYLARGTDKVFKLPYTIINNKEAFMAETFPTASTTS